jgi:DNA-binding protein
VCCRKRLTDEFHSARGHHLRSRAPRIFGQFPLSTALCSHNGGCLSSFCDPQFPRLRLERAIEKSQVSEKARGRAIKKAAVDVAKDGNRPFVRSLDRSQWASENDCCTDNSSHRSRFTLQLEIEIWLRRRCRRVCVLRSWCNLQIILCRAPRRRKRASFLTALAVSHSERFCSR